MTTVRHGAGHRYDVCVVGAGGAGCEAAWRLAEAGLDVLLATTSLDTVFAAPDERVAASAPPDTLAALVLSELTPDANGTVGAWELHGAAKYHLEALPGVHLLQSNVDALIVSGGRVAGVATWEGVPRAARTVALCVGPFLRARLTVGEATERAGRPGEMAYDELGDDLTGHGVALREASADGGGAGRPAWRLTTVRLADDEMDGPRVARVAGLYAAGACVRGPLDYGAAAADGRRMAERLIADLDEGRA